MPAKILSIVNMKGGVGKSTVAVSLAEALTLRHRARVLVIDLDPQSNASIMLAGQDRWDGVRMAGRTIDEFFSARLEQIGQEPLKAYVLEDVADVEGCEGLDIVPATPEFRYVERDAIARFTSKGFAIESVQAKLGSIAASGLRSVQFDYDYVIFDCPPGISLFAESAIALSDYLILPTVPDYISRLGLVAFWRRALRLLPHGRREDNRAFVLATRFDESSPTQRVQLGEIDRDFNRLNVIIPYNSDIARAAEWSDDKRSFEQKWRSGAPVLLAMTAEIAQRVSQPGLVANPVQAPEAGASGDAPNAHRVFQ